MIAVAVSCSPGPGTEARIQGVASTSPAAGHRRATASLVTAAADHGATDLLATNLRDYFTITVSRRPFSIMS